MERSEAALKGVRDTEMDRVEQNQSNRGGKKKGLSHNVLEQSMTGRYVASGLTEQSRPVLSMSHANKRCAWFTVTSPGQFSRYSSSAASSTAQNIQFSSKGSYTVF